ncbi:hypothetical protein DL89DRAFT_265327 [Linderina pennispora]|uniref:DNA-directed RNA polymerase III subunit RPC9 n=1 Tax=Linderina pennispora TaxID=61395 RepID=A0A1Y1WJB8_9FUNG|nr:uncharacterized protein DL89DRAFT_265327 [Linderina pennispora]KAJ1941406.1 hypothetical protein EC988_006768 [Linderina pennispora]ORX73194.1 hypothetical protein DL89DRAFT_265327 [Linderina pennispora]
MKVLNVQEALLSNYEMLLVLQEEDARHKDLKAKERGQMRYPENVTTLKFEALQYLSNTSCTSQDGMQLSGLRQRLAEYELTKAEILQIANLRPRVPVELYLIIEECGDRFQAEDLDAMLEIIASELPREEEEAAVNGDAEMAEQEEEEEGEEDVEDEEMMEEDELVHTDDRVVDEPADDDDD